MQKQINDTGPIESLQKFLESIGRSRTTGYRWRQMGWLKCVTIAGRPYVTREAISEFMRRAESGELADTTAVTPRLIDTNVPTISSIPH
jgi:hypothetical protein